MPNDLVMQVSPRPPLRGPHFTALAAALHVALLALLSGTAFADTDISVLQNQDQPEDVSTQAKNLDKVQVTGKKPDAIGIMPGEPEDGLFGIDKSLAETPRSVTEVSSDLINNYGLEDINDLVRMTPGSYTGSYFGIAGSLSLRGESADNYFRGMKRVQNSGNYATPIRAARTLEIVRGPASPIYGAGQVGGYLNFIPKSANSDTTKYITKATGEAGMITGSYDKFVGWAEGGTPFTLAGQQGGIYAYLQREDSNSYYDNVKPKSTLAQVEVDMDLGEKWSTAFGFQYLHDERIQNPGWNRVTQDLIDHGTYTTGQTSGSSSSSDSLSCSSYSACSLPDDLSGSALKNAGTTHLKHNQVLTDSSDRGHTYLTTGYFDLIRDLDNGALLKNQLFYETMAHYKYTSYGFTANFHGSTFEDKVSLALPFDLGTIKTNTTVGLDYRHYRATDQEAYNNEIFDRRDISFGSTSSDRVAAASKGYDGWSTWNDSIYDDYSAFALSDLNWNKWDLLLGGRYDYYQIKAIERAPSSDDSSLGWVNDSKGGGSYNVSLSYHFDSGIMPYVTYAKSKALDTNSIGGVAVDDIIGGNWLQNSKLKEAGIKYQNHNGNIYAAVDYFDQRRFYRDTQSGTDILVHSKGWEGELRWLISEHFSMSSSLTKMDVIERGAPLVVLNTSAVAAATGLDITQLYPYRFNDFSGSVLDGQWRRGGVPKWVGSIYGNYDQRLGNGMFHASLGVTAVESHYADDQALIKLPGYDLWNGSIGYSIGPWSFLLNIDNITNEKYFTSADLFDSVLVLPSEPREYTATVSYKF